MQTAEMVTKAFLFFLFTKSLVESYLDNRNRKNILANRNTVPVKFSSQITLEEHQKAADYSIAKIKVAKVFNFIELVVLLIWTLGGGIQALDHLARTFEFSELTTGVVFFALYMLISLVLSLPQSIYSTFVLEEKFGIACAKAHISGIKGHRSVGGYRASIYNAMDLESVQALVDVINNFNA